MARSVRPRIFSPFTYARRAFVSRGLLGGNRTWLVIGGTVWAGRLIRRTVGRAETIAATEVLKPGEFVTIRTIQPPTRHERKAARRARV
jgi:hypothetical protein